MNPPPDLMAWLEEIKQTHARTPLYREVILAPMLSSGVDAHGEQFAEPLVRQAADSLRSAYLNYNHDLSIQPIGRVLDTRLLRANDGNLIAYAIIGFFDTEQGSSYEKFSSIGINPTAPPDLPEEALEKIIAAADMDPSSTVEFSSRELPDFPEKDTSDAAPAFVTFQPNAIRKALNSDSVVYIFLPLIFALGNPFAIKLLANSADHFWKWSTDHVLPKLAGTRVGFVFPGPGKTYTIEMHMTATSGIAALAAASIAKAGLDALRLAEAIHARSGLLRLVYKYIASRNTWEPAFAVTERHGVLADSPHLIAMEKLLQMGGFSIGGTANSSDNQASRSSTT